MYLQSLNPTCICSMSTFDMPICQDEVMSVISNMKSGTPLGIDGMPVEILKCFNLPTCKTTFCKNGALH